MCDIHVEIRRQLVGVLSFHFGFQGLNSSSLEKHSFRVTVKS